MAVDKLKPNDPRVQHLTANVRGKTYKYILAKPEGQQPPRATALLIHGWPDLGFGWRYQVPHLTSLGLQVIVPDQLGYGGTDAPDELSLYSLKSVADDMAELVRQVTGDRAADEGGIILGGHDWGGAAAWRLALWHPGLIRGVFSVCTPYAPPQAQYADLPTVVKLLPNFRYQVQLAGPDVEREIRSDPAKIRGLLTGLYGARGPNGEDVFTTDYGVHFENLDKMSGGSPSLLDEDEVEFYVREYTRKGMRGPLNWYRTRRVNYEEELALLGEDGKTLPRFGMPALVVTAENDPALPPRMSEGMEAYFDKLGRVTVGGTHWALWDSTEGVNAAIGKFVDEVLGGAVKASI